MGLLSRLPIAKVTLGSMVKVLLADGAVSVKFLTGCGAGPSVAADVSTLRESEQSFCDRQLLVTVLVRRLQAGSGTNYQGA